MNLNLKQLYKRLFLWLSLGNALAYGLYHASYLLSTSGDIGLERLMLSLEVVRGYASEIWEYLLLSLVTYFALSAYALGGAGAAAGLAGIASLSRVFYSVPYYYMYFISLGYETVEAIPLSLLVTLLMIVATLVLSLLLFLSGLVLTRLFGRIAGGELRTELQAGLGVKNPLKPSASALFLLSTSAVLGISELIKTVVKICEFLAENGLAFDAGELLLMIFELALPLAYTALIYFISFFGGVRELGKCSVTDNGE